MWLSESMTVYLTFTLNATQYCLSAYNIWINQ